MNKEGQVTINPRELKFTSKRIRQACISCQQVKMRCSGLTEEGSCERCSKLGKDCQVKERKPRHESWVKRQDRKIQQMKERIQMIEELIEKRRLVRSEANGAETIPESIQHASPNSLDLSTSPSNTLTPESEQSFQSDFPCVFIPHVNHETPSKEYSSVFSNLVDSKSSYKNEDRFDSDWRDEDKISFGRIPMTLDRLLHPQSW